MVPHPLYHKAQDRSLDLYSCPSTMTRSLSTLVWYLRRKVGSQDLHLSPVRSRPLCKETHTHHTKSVAPILTVRKIWVNYKTITSLEYLKECRFPGNHIASGGLKAMITITKHKQLNLLFWRDERVTTKSIYQPSYKIGVILKYFLMVFWTFNIVLEILSKMKQENKLKYIKMIKEEAQLFLYVYDIILSWEYLKRSTDRLNKRT